jgi:ribosomal protein S18 acetylase RimI-like enzyme
MKNPGIRRVTPEDVGTLQNIARQTFSETFSAVNSEENMKKYLDDRFSEEKLANELDNRESEFYFAVIDDRVIGYLKINSGNAQTESQDSHALEIERIYVLKEFHGRKVGQLLYDEALKIATKKKCGFIWLGVWENNLRALSFYRKNGFEVSGRHTFVLGESRQTDYIMKIRLKAEG